MFSSKKNLRKTTIASRRLRLYWTGSACSVATLCILLHAQAQEAEIARIEAQPQPQQHRAKPHPTATPTPLPAVPPGLAVGNRQIVRQDDTTPPAAAQLGSFNLSALTVGAQGRVSTNRSPLWVESDQASRVVVLDGSGVLTLDTIQAADETVSVRVHDEQGNVVTVSERAYRTPYAGAVESPLCAVRLDSEGNLLPLVVARLTQAEDGSIRVTRDGDFAETLIVHFRLHRAGDNPLSYQYAQNVIVPAGEASAPLPVQGAKGDVLTLAAGFSYTPAPAEQSDVIQF